MVKEMTGTDFGPLKLMISAVNDMEYLAQQVREEARKDESATQAWMMGIREKATVTRTLRLRPSGASTGWVVNNQYT